MTDSSASISSTTPPASWRFWRLQGPASYVQEAPTHCLACGDTHLFRQPDFNRAMGLWIVAVACLTSFVFLYYHANWWLSWSPMLAVVVIDRVLFWMSPDVVICYQCEHLHRGLSAAQARRFEAFDLDEYDRLHYAERVAAQEKEEPKA